MHTCTHDVKHIHLLITDGTPMQEGKREISSASLNKLVEHLTSEKEYDIDLTKTFLITYRSFTTTELFMRKLMERWAVPATVDKKTGMHVCLRVRVWCFIAHCYAFGSDRAVCCAAAMVIKLRICTIIQHWLERLDEPAAVELINTFVTKHVATEEGFDNLSNKLRKEIENRVRSPLHSIMCENVRMYVCMCMYLRGVVGICMYVCIQGACACVMLGIGVSLCVCECVLVRSCIRSGADALCFCVDLMQRAAPKMRVYHFHTPPPAVLPLRQPSASIGSILDVDELEAARQLTLPLFELYSKIRPVELFGQAWNNPKLKDRAPNVRHACLGLVPVPRVAS